MTLNSGVLYYPLVSLSLSCWPSILVVNRWKWDCVKLSSLFVKLVGRLRFLWFVFYFFDDSSINSLFPSLSCFVILSRFPILLKFYVHSPRSVHHSLLNASRTRYDDQKLTMDPPVVQAFSTRAIKMQALSCFVCALLSRWRKKHCLLSAWGRELELHIAF